MQTLLILTFLLFAGVTESQVLRPCGSDPSDRACVSAELALRSRCTIIENGPFLDPHFLDRLPVEAPAFNISEVKSNIIIGGLADTYIKDFFMDIDEGYTVLVLNHTSAYFEGNITVFFHETGKSSIPVDSYFYNHFYNFLTTTVLPGTTSLDLNNGLTYGEQTIEPYLDIGEGLTSAMEIYDRVNQTILAIRESSYSFMLLMTEEGVTVAPAFAKAYIDQNICTYNEVTRWP